MNIKNVIAMINAKLDCIELDNGCNEMCNHCSLNYEQGTVREQKDCLKSAIKYLQSIDDMQTENKRLQHVFDIKDAEHAKLVNENKEVQNENKELRRLINDLKSDLVGVRNDYKQASNEVNLLNKQLDRQNTAVNDLSDIVETSHKVIDDLKKENDHLKLRLKLITKSFLNSIYGLGDFCFMDKDSVKNIYQYIDTDSIKETKDNDSNN